MNLNHSVQVCKTYDGKQCSKKKKNMSRLGLPFANLVGVQLDQWAKAHAIM